MFDIRNLELQDVPAVAKLHMDHMPLTFPPCRPYLNLLKLAYASFLLNEEGFCHVATQDNAIVGYVCFHKRPKEIYITALRNRPMAFCGNVALLFFRFPGLFLKGVPRVLGTLSLSSSTKQEATPGPDLWKDHYELRPIVVRKDMQGKSVAERLMTSGETSLMGRGEKGYFLRVKKDNSRAIAFYNKIGFATVRTEGIRIVMAKALK